MAKSYKPKTKDDEVETIGQVQVEKNEDVVDVTFLTLNFLDTQINAKTSQIATLQITVLGIERTAVETEAKKVKLKEPEPEAPKEVKVNGRSRRV